jgi:hypothetical protein
MITGIIRMISYDTVLYPGTIQEFIIVVVIVVILFDFRENCRTVLPDLIFLYFLKYYFYFTFTRHPSTKQCCEWISLNLHHPVLTQSRHT